MEKNNDIGGVNAKRIKDRDIDEFIGLCRGVILDGAISLGEAEHLFSWLNAKTHIANDWIAKSLHQALTESLQNGELSSDNELKILKSLVDVTDSVTPIPFCLNPSTNITIKGSHIALTGNFTTAKRKDVEQAIIKAGGKIKKNANSNCNYLVIGDVGSLSWRHSSYGRKIEEGMKTRDEKGGHISIISEAHFFNHAQDI